MPNKRIYLEWYRDKGRGQEAADAMGAKQLTNIWPVAVIEFPNPHQCEYAIAAAAESLWWHLLLAFGVNAVTNHCS